MTPNASRSPLRQHRARVGAWRTVFADAPDAFASSRLPARSRLGRLPPFPAAIGERRDLPRLTDEALERWGEEYRRFIAPWTHLVGTEMPTFQQFVTARERRGPRAATAFGK